MEIHPCLQSASVSTVHLGNYLLLLTLLHLRGEHDWFLQHETVNRGVDCAVSLRWNSTVEDIAFQCRTLVWAPVGSESHNNGRRLQCHHTGRTGRMCWWYLGTRYSSELWQLASCTHSFMIFLWFFCVSANYLTFTHIHARPCSTCWATPTTQCSEMNILHVLVKHDSMFSQCYWRPR